MGLGVPSWGMCDEHEFGRACSVLRVGWLCPAGYGSRA